MQQVFLKVLVRNNPCLFGLSHSSESLQRNRKGKNKHRASQKINASLADKMPNI